MCLLEVAVKLMRFARVFMVKQSLALENVKQEGPLPPVLPSAKDYISIPPPKPGYQQRLTHWGKSGGSEGHKTRLSTAGASWCGRVSPHALALLCLPLQQLLILLCHGVFSHSPTSKECSPHSISMSNFSAVAHSLHLSRCLHAVYRTPVSSFGSPSPLPPNYKIVDCCSYGLFFFPSFFFLFFFPCAQNVKLQKLKM